MIKERKMDKDSAYSSKSLRFRLTMTVAFVSLFMGIGMMFFLAYVYQNRINTEFKRRAADMAVTAAQLLESETIDRYIASIEKDEEYYRILERLRIIQRETEVTFIVVTRILEDHQIFVFDTDEDEEGQLDLGETVFYGEQEAHFFPILPQVLQGEPVEPYIFQSRWGWLLKAIHPILRNDGSISAHVSVSIFMDDIIRERNFAFTILGIIILLISITSVTAYLFAIQKFVILPERRRAQEHAFLMENLNRTKSEFYGNISHQMKTPLTIIATDIQLAEQFVNEGNIDSAKELMREAWQETMQTGNLVTEAIALARGQEISKPMDYFDFTEVIKTTLNVFEPLIRKQNNILQKDIANLPHIRGNADMLAGALVNILSNANHHTKDGIINVLWSEISKGQYCLTVHDNGPGIKPEILPNVFKRGVTDGTGTGLGLSIAKSIMELHNGEVKIETEPGKGTKVMMLFYPPVKTSFIGENP